MPLPTRNIRQRNRKFLFSVITACCVGGIDATWSVAADESQTVGDIELELRPARPFKDASSVKTSDDGDASKTLSFRKPVLKPEPPAKVTRGVKVPAKTVSNRTPPKHVSRGWIARNAVNLDQPLRDPGQQQVAQPEINRPSQVREPAKTVTPLPSYVGDQLPGSVEDVAKPKVRPKLVRPQDRKQANFLPKETLPTPSVRELVKEPSATPDAKSGKQLIESKVADQAKPTTSVLKESTADKVLAAPEQQESRLDRIVEQLLPAEGTATGAITKKTDSDQPAARSIPMQLDRPSEKDAAQVSEPKTKENLAKLESERIASSKSNAVIIRKLRIDSDGSDAAESLKKAPEQIQVEQDSDGTAQSYLGDLKPEAAEVEIQKETPPVVAQPLDYVGMPTQPRQASASIRRLSPGMSQVLNHFYQHPEVADGRSNWGMMHAIMVYGADTRVQVGRRTYSTIAWMAGNNFCRGQRLAEHTDEGIRIKSGVGLQGHQAQMLAVFSLSGVPLDYPIYADGRKYSLADVLEAEKRACKSGEELTFTLIALSHYLDTDATWIADDGQTWSVQRLIREELSQPIVGAACGGTHRLMGFAHALRNRRMQGKPIDGQWARAEAFTDDFVQYAYQLQNRDGSMSTNWFEGREDNGNVDRKLQTTGHIVEWLLTVTPDSQLEDPRLVRAVRFLLSSMYSDLNHDWSIGPKGHALRSLAMYHQRVLGSSPWKAHAMAQRNRNSRGGSTSR